MGAFSSNQSQFSIYTKRRIIEDTPSHFGDDLSNMSMSRGGDVHDESILPEVIDEDDSNFFSEFVRHK